MFIAAQNNVHPKLMEVLLDKGGNPNLPRKVSLSLFVDFDAMMLTNLSHFLYLYSLGWLDTATHCC